MIDTPKLLSQQAPVTDEEYIELQRKLDFEIHRKQRVLARMNRLLLMCWLRYMKSKMQAAMQR